MKTKKKKKTTTDEYAKYSDEFISKLPTSAFGYKEKAAQLTEKGVDDAGAKLREEGIRKSAAEDGGRASSAGLIDQKSIYKGDSVYNDCTLDKSIAEAQKAY